MDRIVSRPERLAMLAHLFHAACDLATWCIGKNGELHFSTSCYSKELYTFFESGGCREWAITAGKETGKPFVMSDALGLVWAGEFTALSPGLDCALVLIGPMLTSETALSAMEEKMRERNMAFSLRSLLRQVMVHIPVVSVPTLNQYIRMLHYFIALKVIQPSEYVYQSGEQATPCHGTGGQLLAEKHSMDYEQALEIESLLLQCVREGNAHYEELLEKYRFQRLPDDFMTGDPVRDAKDAMIIFTAQCCRAAIEGRLPVKTAKEMEARAIKRIEKCTLLTELAGLRRTIVAEYIRQVHDLTASASVSKAILACCDYVKAHFMEPIELADIAKAVCYNEYYLTRKFQKEMGIQLRDYIRNVRLEYAKIWLLSTDMSVKEISEQLQFGTRNYFTRVFREQEGITPTEYRQRTRALSTSALPVPEDEEDEEQA